MKCYSFIILLFLSASITIAQDSNVFYDRAFWKTAPDIATVQEKIKEGHDPVALNPFAFDATVYAILENAPLETIQYLLSMEGNEVDKVTHDGRNYLLWAGYKGNIALMKWLIEKGSDTQLIDDHGYNLLTFAATAGQQNTAIYDLILANGGNIGSTNRAGANALLLLAPYLNNENTMQYFLDKGLDLHAKDDEGNGMFNYATRRGNIDLMKKLIDMGVDHQTLNNKGENALLFATYGARGYSNPVKIYEYLTNLGIEADVVSWEGKTPLHNIAGAAKDMAVIDFFTSRGVNLNQVDEEGNTAFINAIRRNNLAIAGKLVHKINDINHLNKEGHSALTYAVMSNSTEAFDLLVKNGANTDVKDAAGNNLVYYIFNSYDQEHQEAFDQFFQAAKTEGLEFAKPFAKGNTLAHIAVEKNSPYLLAKAIAMEVGVNQKNEDGLTPLHLAAMKAKDGALLTLLLDKGADKSILTEFEESAYDLAAENEALMQKGVDLGFLKMK